MKRYVKLKLGSMLAFASLQADFISIDLDMKGLGSLSKMSDDLNKMVEMQKKLDHLPVKLGENNSSKKKVEKHSEK
jgi:hypothetical protein